MEAAKKGDRANEAPRPMETGLAPAGSEAAQARPVKLLRSDSVEDAAVCVFSAALDHFEANIPLFLSQQSAESVHQMRVALRRLRAAMRLFSDALSGDRLETARARARSLGSLLGAARDWDVFHDMLARGPGGPLSDDPGFYALLDAIELRRAAAYRAARAAVEGPEVQLFLSDFRKAVAGRDWDAAPGMSDEASAEDFARQSLTKLRKRALKKSRGLAERTPEERHAARIALKKARYAASFFASLFDRDEAADFVATLGGLQDGLGVFNDMATANRLLDEIDAAGGASQRASGFVRGWFAHAAQEGAQHARKSEKRLKKLEPFWA